MTVATLDVARILPRYRHTQKRLLLIDFEGTIWQRDITTIARNTGVLAGSKREFVPPEDVIKLLNRLAEDPKNQVWLLSGLPVKGMLDVVAEKAPTIGIVYVLVRRRLTTMSLTLLLIARRTAATLSRVRTAGAGLVGSAWSRTSISPGRLLV